MRLRIPVDFSHQICGGFQRFRTAALHHALDSKQKLVVRVIRSWVRSGYVCEWRRRHAPSANKQSCEYKNRSGSCPCEPRRMQSERAGGRDNLVFYELGSYGGSLPDPKFFGLNAGGTQPGNCLAHARDLVEAEIAMRKVGAQAPRWVGNKIGQINLVQM